MEPIREEKEGSRKRGIGGEQNTHDMKVEEETVEVEGCKCSEVTEKIFFSKAVSRCAG